MPANLTFLPWARQGAASSITVPDSLGDTQDAVATVAASLTLNTRSVSGVNIRLRGPADPTSIDANQIVRTDPRPGTTDFEPNCFPCIEFDRPDFPWLFTPAKENAAHRLRPWLCLVVVRKQAGVTLDGSGGLPTTKLTIESPAHPVAELPDLEDSWAWAHVQVAGDGATQLEVDTAFNTGPEQSLSRLICPRVLAAETEYVACVVPTFDLGRRAGLGQSILDTELVMPTGAHPLAPAWTLAPAQAKVELPVFYSWEFSTGQDGDFESLARALSPNAPVGLGTRTIDISHPCFPSGGATTMELEGALLPIPPASAPQLPDPISVQFRTTLASIINEPSRVVAADPTTDPLLGPPMYGRWHAARAVTSPTGTTWFDQLNLDPRWRAAAAFGTRVVQEHQEALMASAWDQAAEISTVNQRLRQLQMSMAVGEAIHRRHFAVQTPEKMLRLAAPAFGRLKGGSAQGASLLASQSGTTLPPAANRSAMRRIGRQRGPLTRRVALKGFPRDTNNTWVAWMNGMWASPMPSQPPAAAAFDFAPLPSIPASTSVLYDPQPGHPTSFYGAFFVAPEYASVTESATWSPWPGTEAPDFFRTAARDHLDRFFLPRSALTNPTQPYIDVRALVLAQMKPSVALQTLAVAIVTTGDRVLPPTASGGTTSGVEVVMAPPYFPQPMYESLRDLSQEMLLPGLQNVAPNTVLGLKTNRRFVEAFMVGLNHEMGRELLWRGYPTDQRATYFDRFWGNGVPNTAPRDITDLNTWTAVDPATKQMRTLGDTFGAPPIAEEFVMLLRSSLLARYPNAVIALVKGVQGVPGSTSPWTVIPDVAAPDIMPLFSGAMVPDVSFFGFPVTTQAAVGGGAAGPGYFIVIQEHPTEPRFGIDDAVAKSLATTHLPVGPTPPPTMVPAPLNWNTHAAEMARITRRLPVRMAIHASRLIALT